MLSADPSRIRDGNPARPVGRARQVVVGVDIEGRGEPSRRLIQKVYGQIVGRNVRRRIGCVLRRCQFLGQGRTGQLELLLYVGGHGGIGPGLGIEPRLIEGTFGEVGNALGCIDFGPEAGVGLGHLGGEMVCFVDEGVFTGEVPGVDDPLKDSPLFG